VVPAARRRALADTFLPQQAPSGEWELVPLGPPPEGVTSIPAPPNADWGPLVISDLVSDDPLNPYQPPPPPPAWVTNGLYYGTWDPQTLYNRSHIWLQGWPFTAGDLDPVWAAHTRRADLHLLQQSLGDHHRLTVTVDSAIALAECGQEVRVYLPHLQIDARFQILRIEQPLDDSPATWTLQYIGK
jgi:hypothetical protein